MSFVTANYGYWEFWTPYSPSDSSYGNQKCIFDGENRLIYFVPGELNISVKEDIYSNWKEWLQVRDNSKYLPALRTTGGDPVGGGLFAGDIYFMTNGWKVVIQEQVTVTGIIYDNDPTQSPFIVEAGGGLRNVVSNLAYAYNTSGVSVPTVTEIRQEMDNNSAKLASINTKVQTLQNGPSAATIADAVRTELTPELTQIMLIESGLTPTQATMLTEIYTLYGLDPTKPLLVTKTTRTAGNISQTIDAATEYTEVTRV
jgi:hypothetical protein